MGVGEQYPRGGKAVQVRGLGLGMPREATDPVVEIVDRDEQHVGPLGGGPRGKYKQERKQERERSSLVCVHREVQSDAGSPRCRFSRE